MVYCVHQSITVYMHKCILLVYSRISLYILVYCYAGGEIVSTFGEPDKVKLGHCKVIEEVMVGEDKLIRFSGLCLCVYVFGVCVCECVCVSMCLCVCVSMCLCV